MSITRSNQILVSRRNRILNGQSNFEIPPGSTPQPGSLTGNVASSNLFWNDPNPLNQHGAHFLFWFVTGDSLLGSFFQTNETLSAVNQGSQDIMLIAYYADMGITNTVNPGKICDNCPVTEDSGISIDAFDASSGASINANFFQVSGYNAAQNNDANISGYVSSTNSSVGITALPSTAGKVFIKWLIKSGTPTISGNILSIPKGESVNAIAIYGLLPDFNFGINSWIKLWEVGSKPPSFMYSPVPFSGNIIKGPSEELTFGAIYSNARPISFSWYYQHGIAGSNVGGNTNQWTGEIKPNDIVKCTMHAKNLLGDDTIYTIHHEIVFHPQLK